MLCGHYGCGGVQAAVALPDMPLAEQDNALSRRIHQLRSALHPHIDDFHTGTGEEPERQNQLVEANVLTQFSHLIATAPVQQAWENGVSLHVYGCVYDLHSGHLKELVQQSAVEAVS